MGPAFRRFTVVRWLQARVLLCLLASGAAHATDVDRLSTRDTALIDAQVQAMPHRAGEAPALYVVGVAGDATEDVFRNEVRFLVDDVAPRFDAAERTLALVNHADSLKGAGTPLATEAGIRHALAAIGRRMDRERDILLLYLTMHGSSDHALALKLPDGRATMLTPGALRHALDEAGIVHRVVVISACFSGGFIPALEGPDTLLLTAARPDRPSFGCGSESTITFFGHAWLLDGLNHERDFAGAYRLAARAIKQRERKLGYPRSSPRIAQGERIGDALARWQATLSPEPTPAEYPYPIPP